MGNNCRSEFLRAVEEDGDWDLLRRTDGRVAKTVRARALWDLRGRTQFTRLRTAQGVQETADDAKLSSSVTLPGATVKTGPLSFRPFAEGLLDSELTPTETDAGVQNPRQADLSLTIGLSAPITGPLRALRIGALVLQDLAQTDKRAELACDHASASEIESPVPHAAVVSVNELFERTELLRGVISVVSRAVSSTTGGSIVGDSSSGGGSWSDGRGREIGGTLTRRGVVATCHGYADTTCSSSASWKPSRIVSSMAARGNCAVARGARPKCAAAPVHALNARKSAAELPIRDPRAQPELTLLSSPTKFARRPPSRPPPSRA